MYIGIDARLTFYRVGGISTYIRRLVRALETLDAENQHTVFHSRKARRLARHARDANSDPRTSDRTMVVVDQARHRLDLLQPADSSALLGQGGTSSPYMT
jgi:hypothetical protein